MADGSGPGLKEAADLLSAQPARGDATWNFYMLVPVGARALVLNIVVVAALWTR